MGIFDELSRDSFFSRKATNKQSSAAKRTERDAEIASEFAAKKDAEVASDLAPGTLSGEDASIAPDYKEGTPANSPNRDTSGSASVSSADSELSAKGEAGNAGFGNKISTNSVAGDTEFGSDMAGSSQYGTQTYSHAGVSFDKLSESEAKISYSGLLSKSGADQVVGVYGFGSNQNWESVSQITMNKDGTGKFTATIPITRGKNVNFAFKDSAENWDNNSGLNYTFVN